MVLATMTTKGQITIPKPIRKQLGVGSGDRIAFRVREDGVVEIHCETTDLMSLFGRIQPKKGGVSIEQMKRAVRNRGAKG